MCYYPCQWTKLARDGGLRQSYFSVVLPLTQSGTAVRVGVVHSTQVQDQTRPGQC